MNLLGTVAQLVERASEERKVTGSIPVGATKRAEGYGLSYGKNVHIQPHALCIADVM